MNQLNDIENNINSLIINEYNNKIIDLSNDTNMNRSFSVDSSLFSGDLFSKENTYVENFLYMKQCYTYNIVNFLYCCVYNAYYYLTKKKDIKKKE